MSYSLSDLKSLSDEQLVAGHDDHAKTTVVGVSYFLAELRHRELQRLAQSQQRAAEKMERLTKWITWLTVFIAFMTVVNVVVVLWTALP